MQIVFFMKLNRLLYGHSVQRPSCVPDKNFGAHAEVYLLHNSISACAEIPLRLQAQPQSVQAERPNQHIRHRLS
jgi:hypothetical protein